MFAGIVEGIAIVESLKLEKEYKRLVIKTDLDIADTQLGDSIAIDGVCLTVVTINKDLIGFDLAEETLRRTALGTLVSGSVVNIERSLKLNDRISGHFVFGHVDCLAKLVDKKTEGVNLLLTWQVPKEYMCYIATKGSLSLSGISLTVGETGPDTFSVYIIPHTLEKTSLGQKELGDSVNLEVDMLARYVVNALKQVNK